MKRSFWSITRNRLIPQAERVGNKKGRTGYLASVHPLSGSLRQLYKKIIVVCEFDLSAYLIWKLSTHQNVHLWHKFCHKICVQFSVSYMCLAKWIFCCGKGYRRNLIQVLVKCMLLGYMRPDSVVQFANRECRLGDSVLKYGLFRFLETKTFTSLFWSREREYFFTE